MANQLFFTEEMICYELYIRCDKNHNWNLLEFSPTDLDGSLDLTFIFPLDEIFAALVLCQELQLFGVDGSTAFLAN